MSHPLFSPFQLRSVTFANRIGVSPMCQYSSEDGFATDWHLVHLGSRAQGGAGLVVTEASAVMPEGRISPGRPRHLERRAHCDAGADRAIRARAGGARRESKWPMPGEGQHDGAVGGERLLAPEEGGWAAGGAERDRVRGEIRGAAGAGRGRDRAVVECVCRGGAARAAAGFDVVEIHAAHGYLLHEFLSPLATSGRTGTAAASRTARGSLLDVVDAVRGAWPEALPVFVRISATDWAEGGWRPTNRWNWRGGCASMAWIWWSVSRAGRCPRRRSRWGRATRCRLRSASAARRASRRRRWA